MTTVLEHVNRKDRLLACQRRTLLGSLYGPVMSFLEIIRPDIPEDPRKRPNSVILMANCIKNCVGTIVKKLMPDFSQEPDALKGDGDLDDLFSGNRYGDRLLGRYSAEDIENIISGSPLKNKLSELGFKDWFVELDLSDCFAHFAYLRDRSMPGKDQFLGFLIVQMGEYSFAKKSSFIRERLPENLDLVNVKWIALQNPKARFTQDRPRLPVQRFPGTGLMKLAFSTLMDLANKHHRDGVLNFPEHIHNAILYRDFRFVDPHEQGRFMRMAKDLWPDIKSRGLATVSWAVYLGFLRCDGKEVPWVPQEMIFPISLRMKRYFRSRQYRKLAEQSEKNCGPFYINWDEAESYCLSQLIVGQDDDNM